MSNESYDVIVVGGGAAGIIAAWRAASLGSKVLLLEKTERLGTKILISGGGKCNITHDGPIEDVLKGFRPNEARFLRPACYRFTNRQVVEVFTRRGLQVYVRPDGRIFPVDRTAKDVVAILKACLEEVGVQVRLKTPATGLLVTRGRVEGVRCGDEQVFSKAVVVSVGGSSYPASGTTGDAWPWARDLGHTVVKIRAALAPIHIAADETWASKSGIAIRNCVLKARQQGKEIARWKGDMLFTHHGVSGPAVLGISRLVAEGAGRGPITLEVDLRPERTFEELTEEMRSWALVNPRKLWTSYLDDILPERLRREFLGAAQVPAEAMGASIDRKARNRIVATLKGWDLGTVRDVPIEKGEVVAGGISLDEVDSQSMRSMKTKGLYLCGEVLDIAGPVGGYNLQAAFATGYIAGETAARDAQEGPT